MKINQQFCYRHSSGEDIHLFVLKNSHGREVHVSNYGGIIQTFLVRQQDGLMNDIVLGFDKMEDYISPEYLSQYSWFGAAIGRYANRIKNGRIEIDGRIIELTKNNGADQLHGGHQGFDKKIWKLVDLTGHSVKMSCTSPDGEEGFPGTLEVTLFVELSDSNELSYTYTATTNKATAVNLTHHGYFNLDTQKTTVRDHIVKIDGSQILEQDNNFVATGKLIPVDGTVFDFRTKKAIGDTVDYDQSFVADKETNAPGLVAEVYSPQSKLTMQVYSTEPVVHFYTGKYIPAIRGKNGQLYGTNGAFCLETQVHPNAINIPSFPNTILRPGEQYHQKTIYKIF